MDDCSQLVARLANTVGRLSSGRIQALLGMEDDRLFSLLQGHTDDGTSSEAEQPTLELVHENLRFELTLGGEPFDAVGFLQEGKKRVRGREALCRTDNGHHITSEEDWWSAYETRGELPEGLRRYWLVTARASPDSVSILYFDGTEWCSSFLDIDGQWGLDVLVLRRRVSSPA